ncbi:NADH oxidase [Cercophora scortea]|uniref:NADH oxidase n=1 Tax=Cercophora scortea TaxID=314031 RepID=A0AAE0M305_9PEZI|nr:NADH oxidase [Cercophora scortea]
MYLISQLSYELSVPATLPFDGGILSSAASASRTIYQLARLPLPLLFSGRTAKNRFLKAAMTEKLASWSDTSKPARGIPGDDLVALYRAWGAGGFGITVTGNILIDHDHIEDKGNMIIPLSASPTSPSPLMAGFQRLAKAGKADGSLLLGQLNHPGRQCLSTIQPHPISASDVQLCHLQMFGSGFGKPRAASTAEIQSIVAAFVNAAVFLDKAGFDGVQLHAAHGYLLAQFLSPTTNRRCDAYGGSCLTNRARIITEIADGIRANTRRDFVLAIKANSVEFQDGGMSSEEAAELCVLLEKHGFDLVELSGGTYEDMGLRHRRESTKAREAFFLEFAEMIVPRLTRTRAYITGGLRSTGAMVDALGAVDGVGLGRPACSEPDLPWGILRENVSGCVRPLVDDDDFGITASLGALQMQRLAKGMVPLDPSDRETVERFLEAKRVWLRGFGGGRGVSLPSPV